MLKVLGKVNLTKLKSISLFKVTILLLISLIFKNIVLNILIGIYLLLDNKKELIFYVSLLFAYYLINNFININKIIGIVEYCYDDYYLINNILFKAKLYTSKTLKIGDILLLKDLNRIEDIKELKNNFLYESYDYYYLFNNALKYQIFDTINGLNFDIKSIYLKIFYGINTYESEYLDIISFSNISYFVLYQLIKKKKSVGFIYLCIISLCFSFEYKYFLLILYLFNKNKNHKISIFLLITIFTNYHYIYNYSITYILLIELYVYLKFDISFKSYLGIISSYLFYEINPLYSLIYKYIMLYQFIVYINLLLGLLFKPFIKVIYYELIVLNHINVDLFNIRGKISIIVLFLFLFFKKYFKKYDFALLCLLMLMPLNNIVSNITFVDVGQGDSILFQSSLNLSNALIDTGSKYNYKKLKKELYKHGINNIDYLIITHNDEDHNGNIENLIDDFNVKNIVLEGEDINAGNFNFQYIETGEYDNDNDNSLVYYLSVNHISFLFTGDISKNVERYIIDHNLISKIDVLKLSHHGSKTASSYYFLSNLLPRIAIISTSGKHNHPSAEVIENLNKLDIFNLSTKDSGSISFYFTKLCNLLKYGNNRFAIIK